MRLRRVARSRGSGGASGAASTPDAHAETAAIAAAAEREASRRRKKKRRRAAEAAAAAAAAAGGAAGGTAPSAPAPAALDGPRGLSSVVDEALLCPICAEVSGLAAARHSRASSRQRLRQHCHTLC